MTTSAYRKMVDEDRQRALALHQRHDAIIRELDAVNPFWWMTYSGTEPEALCKLHITMPVRNSGNGFLVERAENEILKHKRDLVAKHVIPAIYAAVRAGFIKLGELNNA